MSAPSPKRLRMSEPDFDISENQPPHQFLSSPRRASYLSPTRASLARFHPNLLPTSRLNKTLDDRSGQSSIKSATGSDADKLVLQFSGASQGFGSFEAADTLNGQHRLDPENGLTNLESVTSSSQNQLHKTRKSLASTQVREPLKSRSTKIDQTSEMVEEDEDALPTPPQGFSIQQSDLIPRFSTYSSPIRKQSAHRRAVEHPLSESMLLDDRSLPDVMPDVTFPSRKLSPPSPSEDPTALEERGTTENQTEDAALQQRVKRLEKRRQQIRQLEVEKRRLGVQCQAYEKQAYVLSLIRERPESSLAIDLKQLCALVLENEPESHEEESKSVPILQLVSNLFRPASHATQTFRDALKLSDPLPSYKPIEQANPLTMLKVFLPFEITSNVFALAAATDSAIEQVIHLTTVDGLFNASLSLLIDLQHARVVSTTVTHIPSWAQTDLNPWLATERSKTHHTTGSLDPSRICWALGSYLELCRRRAACWARCRASFSHLLPTSALDINLLDDLSRPRLIFGNAALHLTIEWTITPDRTGEAQSTITAAVAASDVWIATDTRGARHKVSALFDHLVLDRGVFPAIQVVVALLFPDEDG